MCEQNIVCAICHQPQKSPKGLGQHVRNQHGLSAQEYYDQYVKVDPNEGTCPVCGKPTAFDSIQRGYRSFCGSRCANRSEAKRNHIKQHIEERTPEQQEAINAKARATRLEHYGDANYGLYGSEAFKQRMLERYGDEYYNNLEKSLETNRRNHGGVLNLQEEGFHERAQQTKRERYGTDHNMDKVRQTCLERYGVEYANQDATVKAKIGRSKRKKTVVRLAQSLKEQEITLLEDTPEGLVCACDRCGADIFIAKYCTYAKIKKGRICPYCHPRKLNYDSVLQATIADFVTSVSEHPVMRDNRTALVPEHGDKRHVQELDIYIPALQVAFEVDGMFWHSTQYKEPSYHVNKTRLCQEHDITLYHIFECEWESKRPIVESRIRSILGAYDNRFYARQCELRQVPSKEAKAFFDANHLQGSARASVTYGLYNGDELVEAMSFGKPRFNKKCSWEIIRMCSKLNTQVVGGAARLLSAFEKEHAGEGKLLSYADLRWSTGSVYESLGFERVRVTRPNYWYFKDNKTVIHRSAFQKHTLADKLDFFDPELTEQENMLENGYNIIYDCGNAVYEKEL